MSSRRDFMKSVGAVGFVPVLSGAWSSRGGAEARQAAAADAGFQADPGALAFWTRFLSARTREIPADRNPFFFHRSAEGLRPAVDIPSSALISDGDVSVSVSVAAFKPSEADRSTFERIQNAQLRLDLLQRVSLLDLLDPIAWTAIAALRPDKSKKLPPLQSLAFDPSKASQKMQNMTLPRGQGQWAFNLYGQRRDGLFSQIVQTLTKEVGRFAPVFTLPALSTTALQAFNEFYGALHTQPEYLLQSNPVDVFATAAARSQAAVSTGVPLLTGTYLLVPVSDASQLTDAVLQKMDVKQGLLVPKETPSASVHDTALSVLPNVTYATLDVTVKPAQISCPGKSGKDG